MIDTVAVEGLLVEGVALRLFVLTPESVAYNGDPV